MPALGQALEAYFAKRNLAGDITGSPV